ncbi:HAMP domain-containing sensor histidine kinase [Neobacillus sp. PS3-40]|uniref:sensor histidine kinase n=1 Tax=Neobacillus sp. PS3-40 TaxID=3070679 RepID=UPI0027E12B20|nr:HAMP domain-containing sensor histidine kinase [Neobacillus sp. PS3-40]WML43082.1 HAMP domain-containing sensor histidine kinase [Neobacillus sp. PS3-40]
MKRKNRRWHRHDHLHNHNPYRHEVHEIQANFHKNARKFRHARMVLLLIPLITFYLLYQFVEVKIIFILLLVFTIMREIGTFIFHTRLEKQILQPIDTLILGVEEIANGNYYTEITHPTKNKIQALITSFNHMAKKLKKGEEMQKEYEENRKLLIANISHDLKTPITSIQGYMEAIIDGVVPEDKMDSYFKIIYSNSQYMNKLIDDLFLFSKIDMDKLDYHFEEVSIGGYTSDLMEEFSFEFKENGLTFNYLNKLEKDYLVKIDRKRIHQAIQNIIGNAQKHGDENDLALKCELYKEHDVIKLSIKDNGSGIPSDKLPYIFNRFYRIEKERTKNLMSTGLGLSISKELVKAHGGDITVNSIVGEGSCFTIILPIFSREGEKNE